MSKSMFKVLFKDPAGRDWCKECATVEQKNAYLKKLTDAGIESHVVGEPTPQLCGCVFTTNSTVYSYVRYEGDAKPGDFAAVDVNENGKPTEKTVIIVDVRPTTLEECAALGRKFGRNTLVHIKKIWQKKLPY